MAAKATIAARSQFACVTINRVHRSFGFTVTRALSSDTGAGSPGSTTRSYAEDKPDWPEQTEDQESDMKPGKAMDDR